MTTESFAPATPVMVTASRTRYAGPIWTLLILAPLIGEVLSGSTRLSFLFVLIPETMVWGCGALLCRELVRRWRAGTTSLLLLGLALSVAEEFVIQQTSLAPLPFPGANAHFGRFLGVNWIYFLFMLGYESVWVAVVPVTVTELLFPARRNQPWLRKRGLIGACITFLFGSFIAWYSWTQKAVPALHFAKYHPPVIAIAAGLTAILLLGLAAYALRGVGGEMAAEPRSGEPTWKSLSPVVTWIAGVAAFLIGCAWFKLIAMMFTPVQSPAWLPLTSGVLGAICAYVLFRVVSRGLWSDVQRWVMSLGAVMACMSVGYLSTAGWTRADLIFKAVINVLALLALIGLGAVVRGRKDTPHA